MANPSAIFYQMGQAVAAKVSLGALQLLAGNNTWTGSYNNIRGSVSIGGTLSVAGSTSLDSLSVLRATTLDSLAVTNNTTVGGNLSVSNDTVINGDLTVNGSTRTISTTNLDVKDNYIRLSQGASAGSYTKDQGFVFERAQGSLPAGIVFDESEDSFVIGLIPNAGTSTGTFLSTRTHDLLSFSSNYGDIQNCTITISGDRYASLSGLTKFKVTKTLNEYLGNKPRFVYSGDTLHYIVGVNQSTLSYPSVGDFEHAKQFGIYDLANDSVIDMSAWTVQKNSGNDTDALQSATDPFDFTVTSRGGSTIDTAFILQVAGIYAEVTSAQIFTGQSADDVSLNGQSIIITTTANTIGELQAKNFPSITITTPDPVPGTLRAGAVGSDDIISSQQGTSTTARTMVPFSIESGSEDNVTVSPGAVNVGSLKLAETPLGDLADFNAGVSA